MQKFHVCCSYMKSCWLESEKYIIKMIFMSATDFDERTQKDSIKPWKEVAVDVIYLIREVEEIQTQNGKATVVTLEAEDGKTFRAFATSLLARDLQDEGTYYIKSLGLKESKTGGKSYYSYSLVKQD